MIGPAIAVRMFHGLRLSKPGGKGQHSWRGWCRERKSRPQNEAVTLLLMDWQAFWLTLRLALVVTALLVVIGFPIAYWIAFSNWRWKFLIEAIVALPIV